MSRHFVTAAIVQAAPGYRELRIGIREEGQADPFALIAVRPMHDTPDVLAAFGWRLVGPLEYIAGPNEERAEVVPCQPATDGGAENLRNTVRREIRARALAILAHPDARHFHPVMLNGDHSVDPIGWTYAVDPIGWTYTVGSGDQRVHLWATAAGRVADGVGNTIRAEAARSVRDAHMMQLEPSPAAEMASARLQEHTGPELARLLLTVRNGGDVLADEEAPADEVDSPVFLQGDRIACADGVVRTVEGMAPAVTGEPARVVVEGGARWIAEDCHRANLGDVLDAHRRSQDAALRLRTGLYGPGEDRAILRPPRRPRRPAAHRPDRPGRARRGRRPSGRAACPLRRVRLPAAPQPGGGRAGRLDVPHRPRRREPIRRGHPDRRGLPGGALRIPDDR